MQDAQLEITNHLNGAAPSRWSDGLALRLLHRILGGNLRRSKAKPRMQILETLALGNKRQVMLIQCDSDTYLIGANDTSVQTMLQMKPSSRRKSYVEAGQRV